MRPRNVLLVIAAGLASAVLVYFGTGLYPMWPLLWLAPIPVLAIAPRLRSSTAFLVAFVAAVENGFALARSARNGLLTLSDNRGRILTEAATVNGRLVSITGKVNVAREKTFYAQAGDWFAWLCVAMFVALLVSRFLEWKMGTPPHLPTSQ